MLASAAECREYLGSHSPAEIADQLRRDQALCRAGKLPSILVHFLPPTGSTLGDVISFHLLPDSSEYGQELRPIRRLQYDSVVQGIKAYLHQMDTVRTLQLEGEDRTQSSTIPTTAEFQSALRVLDYLSDEGAVTCITDASTLQDIRVAVQTQLSLNPSLREAFKARPRAFAQKCYICRTRLTKCHELYPSLCPSCGAFNLASSRLSLPANLDLNGTIALVTGGRINLGYHTALRLLRCGASVIVSTRYPRDAESRYQREPDSEKWASRLKIVGADFRAAKDAFRLVVLVRNLLHDWDGNGKSRKLNILVNNAAQTLTDPLGSEARAVDRENALRGQPGNGRLLIDDDKGYDPRVRGGMQISWTSELEGYNRLTIKGTDPLELNNECKEQPPQKGLHGETEENPTGKQSSWSQTLKDIPYEDMISAHSVNAFVPLILCRELLAFMGTAGELPPSKTASSAPAPTANTSQNRKSPLSKGPRGYIINVSSREGLFEQTPGNPHKRGTHVHTNMSKAAINMITETEASTAWSKYRVAMNTVDPGYMSAAPESYSADGCPIGFDDGAARVLWPVAAGVSDGIVIKGRFLKHFGATEVDVGLGRGNS